MRLKHLRLFGYKTFADPTEFLFDGGITAIIGPNGSGKSNVADAVRWVLGEQSFSLLRAHKSEDMIFSGSERRARMGMAEVTMTLDNSDQWLPVEFDEVAITRRSYRSGENEYLLNGSRVRLRDIVDLLGKSGLSRRTYTVIGQGLVDTALSLHPQERRRLIEEAAGLTLYQSRRIDTLNKIDETRQNLLRVRDLLAEMEPRMKRLQRQAERAVEYEQIQSELDAALRVWYSFQWKRSQEELHRVRGVATYQHEHLERQRMQARELDQEMARVRARQSELRGQLGQWHRESSALHARSEAHQRELAVAEERRRGLIQRRDELQSEIVLLETRLEAQRAEISEMERARSALAETQRTQQAAVDQIQAALDDWQAALTDLRAAWAAEQERLLAHRTQMAETESRLAQAVERQAELVKACDAYRATCGILEKKGTALGQERGGLDAQLQTLEAALSRVGTERVLREQGIAAAQQQQRDLEGQRVQLDRRLGRLQERYELLTRMREEGAGLYEGVRRVLQAGTGDVGRVVGAVAALITLPRELETAIEVALGGQLQDVVVETWADAQAAIAYLKRTQGGRATFLPLDTLRVRPPLQAPQVEGVIGIASELIECAPRLRSVAVHLLGRTVVCRDLQAARQVLGVLQGSYQIVTLEGERVQSAGAVTGGSQRPGQGGLLAREREWRELPEQMQHLQAQIEDLDRQAAAAAAEESARHDELAALDTQRSRLEAGRQARAAERAQTQQQIERTADERTWYQSLIAEAERELADLQVRHQALVQERAALKVQHNAIAKSLSDLEGQIGQMDDQGMNVQLDEQRALVALTRQEQAAQDAELRAGQSRLAEVERQIGSRQRRIDEQALQWAQIDEQIVALQGQEALLAAEIHAYTEQITPAEKTLHELEQEQQRLESREQQVRMRLQTYEARSSQAQLQVARQEEQMNYLRSQIQDDLGLVELEMGQDLSGQPLLPIEPLVSSLPEVEVLPAGLEEQIRALKRNLHRLGAINPTAPDEYDEVLERYQFLSTQSQDLEEAIAHLRQVIVELDEVMQREFKQIFEAVAQQFKTYFARLFNGGSARLQLTDPEDLMNTGIDIVARPPGKRQQGLALLSGGERALTAAALIFAILTVSPTPFCVLDEVDAALDEANVGRFRAAIQELAATTQFVLVTHNRYTIEISDLVYGISMGADGASCVLSRRMSEGV